jgi:DNA-binding GntR family transcriptional regulator
VSVDSTAFAADALRADVTARRRSTSAVGTVIDGIQADVSEGRLVAGQKLTVEALTRQYSVSRGTVREALRRLAAEGLIDLRFNYAPRVRMFSREELRAVNEARAAIEAEAAALAARRYATSDRQREFEALSAAIEKAASEQARETFLSLNRALHDLILTIAGNPVIRDFARQLQLQILQSQMRQYDSSNSFIPIAQQEHRKIVESIRRGDPDAAAAAMRAHLVRQTELFASLPESFYSAEE